jgi:GT2 family glycosyltransferase
MRPRALIDLLKSVNEQILYPNQIIIVDGSTNEETRLALEKDSYQDLEYFKVTDEDRGLTKQRNFGISKVSDDIKIVCFLDDDIILEADYFKNLIATYNEYPNAGGVGGYITNEVVWRKLKPKEKATENQYEANGWVRDLGVRNKVRKKLGLLSDKPPCIMPEFSNGLSIGYFPPINKTYKVQHFMGGVSSFTKEVVDNIKFSAYFEGYGLYEDSDYCLRVSKQYDMYVNTAAKLAHYHEASGRPNQFNYGKMVTRNGWYVWRVGYSKVSFKAKIKWNAIAILLTLIRFSNVLTSKNKKAAFTESVGRIYGLISLIFNKPKISY